jgi:hypothetical protein
MLYVDDQIICRTPTHTPAPVPFPKVNPAGPGDIPDGTLFLEQLRRHIDETSLRSQVRQFASKLATALPPRTVT